MMSYITAIALSAMMQITPVDNTELHTIAEASDYTATATYEQVVQFIDELETRSDIVRKATLGTTNEGRAIPLVILSNPPVENAEQARATGKPIMFLFANIHAGEVCAKEAYLMLARDLALEPDNELLKKLVVVIAPIYNADGNERFAPVEENRKGQNGPDHVGQRHNAQDLDLNRDYIKLESPECRALVRFFTEWNPHITMDGHTTNGSRHRYVLTYDTPLHPSVHPAITHLLRDQLLPTATTNIKASHDYNLYYYGNFNKECTIWTTYGSTARYGGSYQGLCGQMQILSEAYSYATFKDRVIASLALAREVLLYAANHADVIIALEKQVRQDTIEAGRNPQPDDTISIRSRTAAFDQPVIYLGYDGESDTPKDHLVTHCGRFEPTRSVTRPLAYIIEPGHDNVIENLRLHGIEIEPYAGSATVNSYTVNNIAREDKAFQGHRLVTVEATAHIAPRQFAAGSYIVRTAQPLGTLIVILLEPETEDGLVTWNFFDDSLNVGVVFAVHRVERASDLPESDR